MLQLQTAFLVILTSIGVSCVTELISWLMVYRTGGYKRIRDDLDRNARKLEQYKAGQGASAGSSSSGSGNRKENEKKEKKLEESVKNSAREFQQVRMKANMVVGLVNLLVLNRLTALFEGTPVARLPFQPPSWLANNVTHRGLPGDDVRDCGALFLYILCTTFCKLNLAQGAPWAPSRASERAMRPQPAAYDENKNK